MVLVRNGLLLFLVIDMILVLEVPKTKRRVGQTTNVVIGGTVTDDSTREWLALDQKVWKCCVS